MCDFLEVQQGLNKLFNILHICKVVAQNECFPLFKVWGSFKIIGTPSTVVLLVSRINSGQEALIDWESSSAYSSHVFSCPPLSILLYWVRSECFKGFTIFSTLVGLLVRMNFLISFRIQRSIRHFMNILPFVLFHWSWTTLCWRILQRLLNSWQHFSFLWHFSPVWIIKCFKSS